MGATGGVAQNLVPDNLDNSLSYSVLNYLKRLKNQAKIEFEKYVFLEILRLIHFIICIILFIYLFIFFGIQIM